MLPRAVISSMLLDFEQNFDYVLGFEYILIFNETNETNNNTVDSLNLNKSLTWSSFWHRCSCQSTGTGSSGINIKSASVAIAAEMAK